MEGGFSQIQCISNNHLLMEQHFYYQEQAKQIEELNKQIIKQNDQITQQQLQLQQLNIIINVLLNNNAKVSREIENY